MSARLPIVRVLPCGSAFMVIENSSCSRIVPLITLEIWLSSYTILTYRTIFVFYRVFCCI